MTQEEATPPPEVPTPEEIAAVALDLNTAADELGVTITAIEKYLEMKNLGVPAWVRVKGWADEYGEYWSRELGYERDGNTWNISIRETSGHEQHPGEDRVRVWPFNRAPRKSRISAVEKMPELLAELVKEAARTARRLRDKAAEATAFAATLNISATPKKAKK